MCACCVRGAESLPAHMRPHKHCGKDDGKGCVVLNSDMRCVLLLCALLCLQVVTKRLVLEAAVLFYMLRRPAVAQLPCRTSANDARSSASCPSVSASPAFAASSLAAASCVCSWTKWKWFKSIETTWHALCADPICSNNDVQAHHITCTFCAQAALLALASSLHAPPGSTVCMVTTPALYWLLCHKLGLSCKCQRRTTTALTSLTFSSFSFLSSNAVMAASASLTAIINSLYLSKGALAARRFCMICVHQCMITKLNVCHD